VRNCEQKLYARGVTIPLLEECQRTMMEDNKMKRIRYTGKLKTMNWCIAETDFSRKQIVRVPKFISNQAEVVKNKTETKILEELKIIWNRFVQIGTGVGWFKIRFEHFRHKFFCLAFWILDFFCIFIP